MARESFKREQEVLRTLFLDGGAMTRRQFADRLGFSPESLDKVLAELKQAMDAICQSTPLRCEKGAYVFGHPRLDSSRFTQKLLSVLFRLKAVRQTEIDRIVFILGQLRTGSKTLPSIIDAFSDEAATEIDRKTIQAYMDYLIEVGTVTCDHSRRPFRYSLDLSLFEQLSNEELDELYSYVDFAANTDVFSAAGCLLLDSLSDYMRQARQREPLAQFAYKYNYYGRILDEYVCHELLSCISEHRKVLISYGGRDYKRYRAQNGVPSELPGRVIVPVRVVYDHQYGRWYLIAFEDTEGKKPFDVYRFERIEQIEPLPETIPPEQHERLLEAAKEGLDRSWVVSTAEQPRETLIEVRFWFDRLEGRSAVNFIHQRVLREGRWGTIEEENEQSFLYRIAITDTSEIKSWLLSFGSAAEVVAPPALRRAMIEEWKRTRGQYAAV